MVLTLTRMEEYRLDTLYCLYTGKERQVLDAVNWKMLSYLNY